MHISLRALFPQWFPYGRGESVDYSKTMEILSSIDQGKLVGKISVDVTSEKGRVSIESTTEHALNVVKRDFAPDAYKFSVVSFSGMHYKTENSTEHHRILLSLKRYERHGNSRPFETQIKIADLRYEIAK